MRLMLASLILPLAAATAAAQDEKPKEAPRPAIPARPIVPKLDGGAGDSAGQDIQVFKYPDANTANVWHEGGRQWRFAPAADDALGAILAAVDDAVRVQLKLPKGQGLVVSGLEDDGRAAKAGLKANDILLTLAGRPLAEPKDFEAILVARLAEGGAHPAGPFELTLIRGGKPMSLMIRSEPRAVLAAEAPPASEAKAEYYLGVPLSPIDATLKAHLPQLDGKGLVITDEPAEGTPAAKAGIKKNDILVSFDGLAPTSVEALRARVQAVGPRAAEVALIREGKPLTVAVTPTPRPVAAASAPVPRTATVEYYWPFNVEKGQLAPNGVVFAGNQVLFGNQAGAATDWAQIPGNWSTPHQWAANAPGHGPPGAGASADLAKKLDDLSAQVQALTKAVDELRKARSAEGGK